MPDIIFAGMITSTGGYDRTSQRLELSCRWRMRAISMQSLARYLSLRLLPNEFVSNAMYGVDVDRPRWIRFELGAQRGDVVVHGASDRIGIKSPNLVQQFIAGDHDVFARRKESQEIEFLPCHLYSFSTASGHIL